jgi:type I restriction enzyme R subunit
MHIHEESQSLLMTCAISALEHMGYHYLDASGEEQGLCTVTGRAHLAEVVLPERLRAALRRLNPGVASQEIELACQELTRERNGALLQVNGELYRLLREGLPAAITPSAPACSGSALAHAPLLRVIDWQNPAANDWLLVSHFWVQGVVGPRCLPLVLFVNGLPLVLLVIGIEELKRLYHQLLRYCRELPRLLRYNALLLLSNGGASRLGCLGSPWEQFCTWPRVEREEEPADSGLETLLYGSCQPARLLDLIENYTLFQGGTALRKIVARNHQYLGVQRAWQRLVAVAADQRYQHGAAPPLGVLWHTHGSGKSYLLAFFVQKVRRRLGHTYSFLVVSERADLQQQLARLFAQCGLLDEPPGALCAQDGQHLQALLQAGKPLIFVLLSAFETEAAPQGPLSTRSDLIVVGDEIHRPEYDQRLRALREALPGALFLGLTGSPLIEEEEGEARATFGPYLSRYGCRQAVRERITLPLYYEDRTPLLPEARLPGFAEAMQQLAEASVAEEQRQQQLGEWLTTPYSLLTRPERLDVVARDLVDHFLARGSPGKALVVTIDKLTAVRLYNRVRAYWPRALKRLQRRSEESLDPLLRLAEEERLRALANSDMAVIVEADAGDYQRFAEFNRRTGRVYCEEVDIGPHHERMLAEPLAERFRNEHEPLRLAFVCGPWLTGFDAPCLTTLYLDRPMQGPLLMQTVALANRLHDATKVCGLIVDYADNAARLREALLLYEAAGTRDRQRPPASSRLARLSEIAGSISEKRVLLEELERRLKETLDFCARHGVQPETLYQTAGDGERLATAARFVANRLLMGREVRVGFLERAALVQNLYQAALPDEELRHYASSVLVLGEIARIMRAAMRCRSFEELLERVPAVLARSHSSQGGADDAPEVVTAPRRLSFARLTATIKKSSTPLLKAEQLHSLLAWYLQRLAAHDPGYVEDFRALEQLFEKYDAGHADLADYPEELLAFTRAVLGRL